MPRIQPRIAVIGCGAISQCYHLPALVDLPGLRSHIVLVDRNREQLDQVSREFGIAQTACDYHDVMDEIDAAVIATPPLSHHPIALELLTHGISVLCEKPLTEELADARQLVEAAKSAGKILAVNHPCRLFPTYQKVRELIAEGVLGELQSITYHEGAEFSWPGVSGFYFAPEAKGALSDTGIHLLDTVCWWLDAQPELVSCQTDSFGGPEAVALVHLRHRECQVEVKVSRLSRLANRYCIVGTRGRIEASHQQWHHLDVQFNNGEMRRIRLRNPHRSFNSFGRPMLRNFVDAIAGRAPVAVPGESSLSAIAVLEQAYQQAMPFRFAWNETLELMDV